MLDGGCLAKAMPRYLYPLEKDPLPIVQEARWASVSFSKGAENLDPSPGLDPRIVQPVASRYTDWAIPAAKLLFMKIHSSISEALKPRCSS
jgi:hypothetical protein